MQIEVATESGDTTKQKGDLFEGLVKDLLSAQGYEVETELRVTGAELDLLCKHKINAKEIYVECKAQKEKISAPILNKLIGIVNLHDYAEGWIISTSEFGKDALGIVDLISKKPKEKSSQFSFYTPERVVNSLISAGVIKHPPKFEAENFIGNSDNLGSWTLLISKYGRFWAVYTLKGGIPDGVLIFHASSQKMVNDSITLENISKLDSIICDYDVLAGLKEVEENDKTTTHQNKTHGFVNVVEVQIGDSWDDYRPARPKDFVGRDDMQKEIINFLSNVRDAKTSTRIFAITGNSGLGKSSLIAKIRDRAKNKHYSKKYFIYAVDIRGAKSPAYITSAFLTALKEAQNNGFGKKIELQLNDPNNYFSSESIAEYLESVKAENKIICLICDQFEELYSKPELFSVFTAANNLMLDVAAFKGNFTLGFAWKTDSTTQQDHPAYHMWHNLSDMRREFRLGLFDSGEISKSITTFEKEFNHKISPAIRNQISYGCQGFPWLLKKLCINLKENIKRTGASEIAALDLDVEKLFTNDLDLLTQSERTCLDLIANRAPADWSEIIELSSATDVSNLVNKRMVVKSGDRLNIYWDIFKDYLVTKKLPVIPYNYIPTTEFSTLIKVASFLDANSFKNSEDISKEANFKEKTIMNIGADLVMFNIAERNSSSFKLNKEFKDKNETDFLLKIRERFGKHSFKVALYKKHLGKLIDLPTLTIVLKESLPKALHSEKTWDVYVRRLAKYLHITGYVLQNGDKYHVQDMGGIQKAISTWKKRGKDQKNLVFSPNVSPFMAIEAYNLITNGCSLNTIIDKGCRNGLSVLKRFKIIEVSKNTITMLDGAMGNYKNIDDLIWSMTKKEESIQKCITKIKKDPTISNISLGRFISDEYDLSWSHATTKRFGNSLSQWSRWVISGENTNTTPPPPGKKH
ncbi:restriction endonuclease [Klebsiella aerogenes]|uniref:restriction endonuclease n=1 Tax=Klebsiella aerogenes TaxID=548 RepID=UPI0013D77397|nr:restriction endonuclease [Klebsiella aerogenes]EIV6852338.1 restriction endonuclease [Klebsiella aerogenes]